MSVDAIVGTQNLEAERAVALLQLRGTPQFFIADPSGTATYCSPELSDTAMLARCEEFLAGLLASEGTLPDLRFERLNQKVMLRIVPLVGGDRACYAVFVEAIKRRNSLQSAVTRFDISRREADVLELLVAGTTTSGIAERLCISEGTVGDHIKALFRKTNTNKRSELIARVFRWEGDVGHARFPVPSRRASVTRTYQA